MHELISIGGGLVLVAGKCLLPVKSLLLCALLLAAASFDLARRRIPNALVLSGLVLAVYSQLALPLGSGLWASLGGMGLAALVTLPLYLLRAMGAGDVKLLVMVGAFLGPLDTAGALLATFAAGGALSLLYALRAGAVRRLAANLGGMLKEAWGSISVGLLPMVKAPASSLGNMPFGVAIAAGTTAYLYYANWLCL